MENQSRGKDFQNVIKFNLPASSSDLIRDRTFSSAPNSEANFSSRNTNDFIVEKLKPAFSLTGEESFGDAKRSFIDLIFFPDLQKG